MYVYIVNKQIYFLFHQIAALNVDFIVSFYGLNRSWKTHLDFFKSPKVLCFYRRTSFVRLERGLSYEGSPKTGDKDYTRGHESTNKTRIGRGGSYKTWKHKRGGITTLQLKGAQYTGTTKQKFTRVFFRPLKTPRSFVRSLNTLSDLLRHGPVAVETAHGSLSRGLR